jgi:hypothetical protein
MLIVMTDIFELREKFSHGRLTSPIQHGFRCCLCPHDHGEHSKGNVRRNCFGGIWTKDVVRGGKQRSWGEFASMDDRNRSPKSTGVCPCPLTEEQALAPTLERALAKTAAKARNVAARRKGGRRKR